MDGYENKFLFFVVFFTLETIDGNGERIIINFFCNPTFPTLFLTLFDYPLAKLSTVKTERIICKHDYKKSVEIVRKCLKNSLRQNRIRFHW